MKRVLSTIMMLALLCGCLITAAFAADIDLTYDLTVNGSNSVTVQTGDVITVTYTIHGSSNYSVNAIQNEIKFDESFFEFVDANAVVGVGHLVEKIAGPRVYMNDTLADYAAEQIVGTFRLRVIAASGAGKVESTDCLAFDRNGEAMTVATRDLTVTIGGSTPVEPGQPGEPDEPGESGKPDTPADSDAIRAETTPADDGSYTVEFIQGGTPVTKLDESFAVSVPAAGGNVVIATYSDGSQVILGKSLVEDGSAYFLLNAPATVQVIDNTKYFADVADSAWYQSAVDFASSHELFNGISNTQFAPDMTMTRAMLVTVLYRLEGEPTLSAKNAFTDVENGTWYTDAVIWANENGIVEGYGGGLFGPEDSVTREQMATILHRYMLWLGQDVSVSGDLSAFSDGSLVSDWAQDAMRWATGAGILIGDDLGQLNPQGSATRAEVATMLMRLVTSIVK